MSCHIPAHLRIAICHRETEAVCPTKDMFGEPLCELGREVAVYQLKLQPSGAVTATLSEMHRIFLVYLANIGGECSMDWDSAENQRKQALRRNGLPYETIRSQLRPLISQGLMTEVPLVGSRTQVMLRLTDSGRNVVTQIRQGKKQ